MIDDLRLTNDDCEYSIRQSSILNSQSVVPPAPWELAGSALVFLDFSQRRLGVHALVHYDSSPVGAYDERALAVLTRRGPSVVQMQVNSQAELGLPENAGRFKLAKARFTP